MSRNGRRVASPWAAMPCEIMRDPRLSIAAKGLYAYLLAFPDNWEFHFWKIQQDCGIGRDKRIALMNELEALGLVHRVKTHSEDGKWQYEFIVGEMTQQPETSPCEPAPDLPYTVNTGVIHDNEFREKENKKEREDDPHAHAHAHARPKEQKLSALTQAEGSLAAEIDRICGTDRTAMIGYSEKNWREQYQSILQQGGTSDGLVEWEAWYYGKGKWANVPYQQEWQGKKNQRPDIRLIASTYSRFKADSQMPQIRQAESPSDGIPGLRTRNLPWS